MAEAVDDTFNDEEEFLDALTFLKREYRRRVEIHGPNSEASLRIKGLIVGLLHDRGDITEALITLFDLYSRRVKVLGLKHECTIETRFLIKDLVKSQFTPTPPSQRAVEIATEIYPYAVRAFRSLVRNIKNMYKKGLYKKALSDGLDVLEDIMDYFPNDHPLSYELGAVVAMVYAETEDYDYAQEIIEDVYAKRCKPANEDEDPDVKSMASTLMKKASILLRACKYEHAMKCYVGAEMMRRAIYGTFHRKTVAASLGVAEVCYNIGNYENAKTLLRMIGKFQKKRERPEILLTYIHNGNLEFARGKFGDALANFRKASKAKRAPLRVRAMIFRQIGAVLTALGRYAAANRALQIARRIILKTQFHTETMIIYRYIALVLQKRNMITTARNVLESLIPICERTLGAGHSVVLTLEKDLGELFFSTGQYVHALGIFRRLLNYQNSNFRSGHPSLLNTKCKVAKVTAKLHRYGDALDLYEEVIPVLAGHYYPQHRERIITDIRVGSIYQSQGYYSRAFEMYYKSFEVIEKHYGVDHKYTKRMVHMMQAIADRIPMRRIIQATLVDSIENVIVYAARGDDVNVRDINGAIPLHYAAREGYHQIVRCLLGKGAIYDANDMFGNTPESFSKDSTTKFLFMLVKRLFRCVRKNDIKQSKQIIQRESLIINARDDQKRTPLQWAVALNHLVIVKELVAHDADLMLSNPEDGTVLHMAAERGHANIMYLLLEKMFENRRLFFRDFIDSRENFMSATAMHIAAKNDYRGCVGVLASFKANPLERDVDEKFPYDYGSDEMREYLIMYTYLFLSGQL